MLLGKLQTYFNISPVSVSGIEYLGITTKLSCVNTGCQIPRKNSPSLGDVGIQNVGTV
jgi:hypothetical protein